MVAGFRRPIDRLKAANVQIFDLTSAYNIPISSKVDHPYKANRLIRYTRKFTATESFQQRLKVYSNCSETQESTVQTRQDINNRFLQAYGKDFTQHEAAKNMEKTTQILLPPPFVSQITRSHVEAATGRRSWVVKDWGRTSRSRTSRAAARQTATVDTKLSRISSRCGLPSASSILMNASVVGRKSLSIVNFIGTLTPVTRRNLSICHRHLDQHLYHLLQLLHVKQHLRHLHLHHTLPKYHRLAYAYQS